MFTCTTGTELINHSLECRKRRGAGGPDVSAVSFLLACREHLNRGLIGVVHTLGQHLLRSASNRGWSCTPVCPTHCASVERAIASSALQKTSPSDAALAVGQLTLTVPCGFWT